MDDAAFTRALGAYRVVRASTSRLPRLRRRRMFGSSGAKAPAPRLLAAGAATPPASSAVPDFWRGLEALLASRLPPAKAKAAASAFDALHYDSVRVLSLEDVEDLSRMLAGELGVPLPQPGAA